MFLPYLNNLHSPNKCPIERVFFESNAKRTDIGLFEVREVRVMLVKTVEAKRLGDHSTNFFKHGSLNWDLQCEKWRAETNHLMLTGEEDLDIPFNEMLSYHEEHCLSPENRKASLHQSCGCHPKVKSPKVKI